MVKPISTASTSVQNRLTNGSARLSGSTPRIEIHRIGLRPIRSPIGPPISVPTATAPRNRNRWIWALPTDTANRSIMKKV